MQSPLKHTPGPWQFIPRSSGAWGPRVHRGHQGGFVVKGLSPEAEDADARLIAAAPDMLLVIQRHLAGELGTWHEMKEVVAKATGQ